MSLTATAWKKKLFKCRNLYTDMRKSHNDFNSVEFCGHTFQLFVQKMYLHTNMKKLRKMLIKCFSSGKDLQVLKKYNWRLVSAETIFGQALSPLCGVCFAGFSTTYCLFQTASKRLMDFYEKLWFSLPTEEQYAMLTCWFARSFDQGSMVALHYISRGWLWVMGFVVRRSAHVVFISNAERSSTATIIFTMKFLSKFVVKDRVNIWYSLLLH